MKESDAGSSQWAKWVVEAINKIRQQKQRPSLERVCHGVRANHSFSESTIADKIEQLVDEGFILKVFNKGKCSYKDPGGIQGRSIVVTKDSDLTKLVVRSIKEIDDPDGSSVKTIEKYIQQSNSLSVKPGADLTHIVKSSLKRAVEKELLTQEGKTYKATGVDEAGSSRKSDGRSKKGTPGGKSPRKSKKKLELESPKKNALPICGECLGTSAKNKNGEEEKLSECVTCGVKVHPSCLSKHQDLLNTLTTRGNSWRCEDCTACAVCNRTTNKICLIKCGLCERCFHMDCMLPVADKKNPAGKGSWTCCYCMDGGLPANVPPPPVTPNKDATTPHNTPKFNKSLRVQQLRSLRKAARASLTSKKGQQVVQTVENSSEDGNHPDTSSSSESSHSHSSPIRTSDSNPGGRRLELSEVISKEKQKFFMGSAFFKRYNTNKVAEAKKVEPVKEKIGAITPVTPLTQFPRHVPPLNPSNALSSKTLPFAAFCTDSDEPWGFAAVKAPQPEPQSPALPVPEKKKEDKPCVSPSQSSLISRFAVSSKAVEAHQQLLAGVLPAVKVATITSLMSMSTDLPPGVTQKDLEFMRTSREIAVKKTREITSVQSDQDILAGGSATVSGLPGRCPASIEFGPHEIKTWYSSPFPQEYARLGKLFLCEFCLKYTKSKAVLKRHLDKCTWKHPPGTEIYRHQDLSVFEVDGNTAKFYCQNLCLLAKLFLDHKTLYYDVEPFLFYVLTKNDDNGFHLVGYFSKEKHCLQKYNVSCIMTLPHYQRKGYGRFLIDFSYLLSKEEGQPGTPEKPLSDLGRVSYHAYWKSIVLEYLNEHRTETFVPKDLSERTGVAPQDIADVLMLTGMIRVTKQDASEDGTCDKKINFVTDWSVIDSHAEKLSMSKSRIPIEPECLRWTPLLPASVNPYRRAPSQASDADGEDGDDEGEDIKPDIEKIKPERHSPIAPEILSKSPVKTPQKSRRRATIKVERDIDNETENEKETEKGRGKGKGKGKDKDKSHSPYKDTAARSAALTSRPRVNLTRITDSSDSESPITTPKGRSSTLKKVNKPKQQLLTDMFRKNVEKTPVIEKEPPAVERATTSGRSPRKSVVQAAKRRSEVKKDVKKEEKLEQPKSPPPKKLSERRSEKSVEKATPTKLLAIKQEEVTPRAGDTEVAGRSTRRVKNQKRPYKEMEEDDIEAVSPPPPSEKRKMRKTEPARKLDPSKPDLQIKGTPTAPPQSSAILRPSRLKLLQNPEPSAQNQKEDKVGTEPDVGRRLSVRSRRERKPKVEEGSTLTPQQTPHPLKAESAPAVGSTLNKRQLAAKERWVKRKLQLKKEKEEEQKAQKTTDQPKRRESRASTSKDKKALEEEPPVERASRSSLESKSKTLVKVKVESSENMDVDSASQEDSTIKETDPPVLAPKRGRGWTKGIPRKNYTPKESPAKPRGKITRKWGVKPRRRKHHRKPAVEEKEPVEEKHSTPDVSVGEAEVATANSEDGPQSSEVDDGVQPESPPKEGSDTSSDSSSDDESSDPECAPTSPPAKEEEAEIVKPTEPAINGSIQHSEEPATKTLSPEAVENEPKLAEVAEDLKDGDLPKVSRTAKVEDNVEPTGQLSESSDASPEKVAKQTDVVSQGKAAGSPAKLPSPTKEIIDLVADEDEDQDVQKPESPKEPDTLETPKKDTPPAVSPEITPAVTNLKNLDDRSIPPVLERIDTTNQLNPPVLERMESDMVSTAAVERCQANLLPPEINHELPSEPPILKDKAIAVEPDTQPPPCSEMAPVITEPPADRTLRKEPEPPKMEQHSAFEPPALTPPLNREAPRKPDTLSAVHQVSEHNRSHEIDSINSQDCGKSYDTNPCKKPRISSEADARKSYIQQQEMMRKSYEEHQEMLKKSFEQPLMEYQKKGFEPPMMEHQKRSFDPSMVEHQRKGFEPPMMEHQKKGFEPPMMEHQKKGFEPTAMELQKKGFEPPMMEHQKKAFEPQMVEHKKVFEPPIVEQQKKVYEPPMMDHLKKGFELPVMEHQKKGFEPPIMEHQKKGFDSPVMDHQKKGFEPPMMDHQKKGFEPVMFPDHQKRAFEMVNSQDPHKKRLDLPQAMEQKKFEPISVPLPATTMADHSRKAFEPIQQHPDMKKGFEPVDHQKKPSHGLPMEVDLTQTDDSRSPAPPPPKPQLMDPHTPPPSVMDSHHHHHHHQRKDEEKKIMNTPVRSPYPDAKLHQERYSAPTPMKEKKDRKSHSSSGVASDESKQSHRHDEVSPQQSKQSVLFQSKQPESGGMSYGESPHPLSHSYGCSDLDMANESAASSAMMAAHVAAEQQRLQYSDCAQQGLAVLHHLSQHSAPPHMHLGYQTQQNRSSKQSVNSRSSRVPTQNRQSHQSPAAHYHQSNYMMPQSGAAYVSMLAGHRMQAQQAGRLGQPPGSCSVSTANFYLPNVAASTTPSGPQGGGPPPPHSSLAKLQQLTNGLDGTPVMGGGTPPPTPPSHSTPPPANNHYQKFYQTQRHPNIQPGSGHNMLSYQTPFANGSPGYAPQAAGRASAPSGYPGAGFINQGGPPGLQMQMMQPQYPTQDPQQNSMYPPYGVHNSYLMQPLNSPMRR